MSDADVVNSNEGGATPIAPFRLVLTLLGPIALIAISHQLQLNLEWKVFIGVARSSVQLLFLGFVLLGIIFSMNSPIVVFAYLTMMILIAALEAKGRQVRTYQGHYWDSLLTCLVSGGFVGIYASAVIFHPRPWWTPAVLIPTSGMIIGNSVSGPAVAVERLLSEVAEKKHESETRLAFGASSYESVLGIVKAAIQASLLPTMNQMAIMGLVSIPGMMTGQLLGGTAPAVAAEYQMAILYLILTTATIASFMAVLLAVRHACFDQEHRLTPEKLIKSGKVEIDQAIVKVVWQNLQTLWSCLNGELVRQWWVQARSSTATTKSLSSAGKTMTKRSTNRVNYSELTTADDDSISSHGLVELPASASASKNGKYHDETKSPMFTIDSMHGDEETGDVEDQEGDNDDEFMGRVKYTVVQNESIYLPPTKNLISRSEFLNIENLNVRSGEGKLFCGAGLRLSLRHGERVTLEGPSGIGKTRLLRALAELDPAYRGAAVCRGMTTNKLTPSAPVSLPSPFKVVSVPEWRRHVIYVPQALPPLAGAPKDLIREACKYKSRQQTRGAQVVLAELDDQCKRMELSLGLRADLLSASWSSLSGGERQRAAIACGLILATAVPHSAASNVEETKKQQRGDDCGVFSDAILLLDEPTAACDPETTQLVERALVASGCALLIITHNQDQAQRLAHRRILLHTV